MFCVVLAESLKHPTHTHFSWQLSPLSSCANWKTDSIDRENASPEMSRTRKATIFELRAQRRRNQLWSSCLSSTLKSRKLYVPCISGADRTLPPCKVYSLGFGDCHGPSENLFPSLIRFVTLADRIGVSELIRLSLRMSSVQGINKASAAFRELHSLDETFPHQGLSAAAMSLMLWRRMETRAWKPSLRFAEGWLLSCSKTRPTYIYKSNGYNRFQSW